MSRTAQTTPEVMSATAGQDTDSTLMDVDVTVLATIKEEQGDISVTGNVL